MALISNTQTGSLTGKQKGTNDHLIGGDGTSNRFYGDATNMRDNARGGNDVLIGGVNATNTLYGDASEMHDNSDGGNDLLIGSNTNPPSG